MVLNNQERENTNRLFPFVSVVQWKLENNNFSFQTATFSEQQIMQQKKAVFGSECWV